MKDGKMARALGAAGIGIGVTELVAPRWIHRQLGIEPRPWLTRVVGLREVASGLGILATDPPRDAQWSRVVGDVIDLALLGFAVAASRRRKVVLGVIGAVVALGVLDVVAARRTR